MKDVRVAPTEAADKVDQKLTLPKIARTLGANLLVQGVLQAARDKIRITMKLKDVANDPFAEKLPARFGLGSDSIWTRHNLDSRRATNCRSDARQR
jgi:TolB-like protein